MMNVLTAIAWSFFRRFWGGWLNRSEWHFLKIGISFALACVTGLFLLDNSVSILLYAAILTATWLNPFHHKAQEFSWKANMWCVGSYGTYMLINALVMSYFEQDFTPLLYVALAPLTCLGYLFGWYVAPKILGEEPDHSFTHKIWNCGKTIDGKDIWFIDGPTALGELWLGFIVGGGLALSRLISG